MTSAVELINPEVAGHHKQTAFWAYEIADTMGIPLGQQQTLIFAALLHDIGSIPLNETLDYYDENDQTVNRHAIIGARLFSEFPRLQNVADVIRFHHIQWDGGKGQHFKGKNVPFLSHILHLADRIAIQVKKGGYVVSQIPAIKESISRRKGLSFPQEAVNAFLQICDKEALWLDSMDSSSFLEIPASLSLKAVQLTLDETVNLTQLFSGIIDFRSPFTALHSAGVSAVAYSLAKLCGLSENECKMMSIAGNLHDIGKIAIPKEILEKQDRLEPVEYDIIRSHTYYTYRLLKPVSGFEEITQWAAYHHEKLNGCGYPFHIKADGLSLGARIMAVADIFTAITEDRPYRAGMQKKQTLKSLKSMVDNGSISPSISSRLAENYGSVDEIRRKAAASAASRYQRLLQV